MSKLIESIDFIFNTVVEQKVYVRDCDSNLILEKATNIMREFEHKLSFYDKDSEINEINKNAGVRFVKVSLDTFEIIKKSICYSDKTNGLFDITVAPLVKEWGINSNNPNIPSNEKIKDIISIVDYRDILIDEVNLSVMLYKKNQQIDLGGIAKGYIADKVIELYKKNNITSAIINIGGNIKVLGKKDEDCLWRVGIYEPKKHSEEVIGSLDIKDLSVVTSGGYERAFISEDKVYHHILNPHTGYPCKTDLKSITIISEDSIMGDAFSTPLFIMGKYMACDFVKFNNLSCIMITEDDEIIITKDLVNKFSLFCDKNVLTF